MKVIKSTPLYILNKQSWISYYWQSVIKNFRAASGVFKKGHFWRSFTQKYVKITLLLEKRTLFCQIWQGAASDYRTRISFGLFHDWDRFVIPSYKIWLYYLCIHLGCAKEILLTAFTLNNCWLCICIYLCNSCTV